MQGILLVDKPAGWTSFDVVNYVRRRVAQAEQKKPKSVKVGHSGTLDPLATGLLILLVGKAYTKRAAEFTKFDKTYEVTMRVGVVSTTGDEEGEKTVISSSIPSKEEVLQVLEHFSGELSQVPPIYSAIKVNGERAYKLARQNRAVVLAPRAVTIYSNELLRYAYPLVYFRSKVSSGTYIRSLVEDIGKHLGTGAYMKDLSRLSVGRFQLSEASEPTAPDLLERIAND